MDVKALIIRNSDYGEKDKILTLATPFGIITAIAKGVRSPKSKLRGFVGILNFGEFGLSEGRNGYILNAASVTENFQNCWTDTDRYAAAMLCLEIYEKSFENGERLPFTKLLRALGEINYNDFYPPAEALKYGVQSAAEIGLDVTEGVFPEDICEIFTILLSEAAAEELLRDASVYDIKRYLKHLALGYRSELSMYISVAFAICNN